MSIIASTGIVHTVSSIFQPVFHFFGWLLASFYQLVPNYVFAIAALTIVIMLVLTPLTIKQTKSMLAMQRLQPQMKKLQAEFKGAENRQALNEAMMKLYKEEGANPLSGCLPVLVQGPFLFVLYSVIKGLAQTVTVPGSNGPTLVGAPRYIPTSSKMYHDLQSHVGQIKSFGVDLSLKPFSHHGSVIESVPFFAFVAFAVFLQWFQMAQINRRSVKAGQPMPKQQLMMQRIMPVMFAYFYIVIPAAVVLYMIVSTLVRIATQDILFRTGISNPNHERNKKVASAPLAAVVEADKPSTLNQKKEHPRSKAKRERKDR